MDYADDGAPLEHVHGAEQVVRTVYWPHAASWGCLTGGEDGQLCLWSAHGGAAATKPRKHTKRR